MRARCIRTLAALLLSVAVASARGDDPFPGGLTPPQSTGGFVSIPGTPLPPVSKESVRDVIRFYEPTVNVLRVFGRTAMVARGEGYLATLYAALGENAKAEQFFDDAQAILQKVGATGRDLGWLHNNRGLVRLQEKRYADAVRFFRLAVAQFKPDENELIEFRAIALQNLAASETILGDVDEAESAYFQALDLLPAQGRTADVVHSNLALLYTSIKDYRAARKLLEPLVSRRDVASNLKFAALNNLGQVLYASGDTTGATEVLQKAMALAKERSEERLLVLTNLAAARLKAGDLDAAPRDAEEALRIAETLREPRSIAASTASLGSVALARGDLDRAGQLLGRARTLLSQLDGTDDVRAGVIQELALVAQRRADAAGAAALSREALVLEKKNLQRILAFGSEEQRLAYRSNVLPYDQLATLGDANLLADAVLATKGVVLESLLAERAQIRKSRLPADRERLDRIHALKVALMEKTARGATDIDALRSELTRQEAALARSLNLRPPSASPAANLAAVQAALGDGEVLVEIVRYLRYDGGIRMVPSYGGIVIPGRGNVRWVPLEAADTIEPPIAALLKRLDVGTRGIRPPSGVGDVVFTLHDLYDRIWRPLSRAFPEGVHKVTLSPDGVMHFIPWAVLLDENDKYLVENWQLIQVGSGRDLVRGASQTIDKSFLILADGANDLPYARRESAHLAGLAEANGWRTTVWIGDEALESRLFQHRNPGILHFATHGGQLGDAGTQSIESRLGRNPMYCGVLLLAGSRETLAAWKGTAALPAADDGVLTAEEIAGLDLGRTWLTVLSACRSGIGEASIGEGVLGLHRGFALAGTAHLLFSLWSIDDEATARFMDAFYGRLFQTGDPARALNETQVDELRRWTRIEGIDGAVFRAGGFVLAR